MKSHRPSRRPTARPATEGLTSRGSARPSWRRDAAGARGAAQPSAQLGVGNGHLLEIIEELRSTTAQIDEAGPDTHTDWAGDTAAWAAPDTRDHSEPSAPTHPGQSADGAGSDLQAPQTDAQAATSNPSAQSAEAADQAARDLAELVAPLELAPPGLGSIFGTLTDLARGILSTEPLSGAVDAIVALVGELQAAVGMGPEADGISTNSEGMEVPYIDQDLLEGPWDSDSMCAISAMVMVIHSHIGAAAFDERLEALLTPLGGPDGYHRDAERLGVYVLKAYGASVRFKASTQEAVIEDFGIDREVAGTPAFDEVQAVLEADGAFTQSLALGSGGHVVAVIGFQQIGGVPYVIVNDSWGAAVGVGSRWWLQNGEAPKGDPIPAHRFGANPAAAQSYANKEAYAEYGRNNCYSQAEWEALAGGRYSVHESTTSAS